MGYRSGKPKPMEQPLLCDITDDKEGWEALWETEWQQMPEYEQKDLTPYRMIYMFFKSEEDVKDFEKKIGQKIHALTKSYWHPKAEIRVASDKLWVDEDEFDREYTEFGETQEEYEPEIPSLHNK
ncbi:MAG: hypothetical protein Unbinned2902contig1001_24 [Prokaryotic dsDNA virus sp.]|nr:MAG: hypothetical protein Unbinned2902contig1001_24 [Prokaryotic dsDNA virus sp.]|tara:strand:- start:18996 stop:19370 length:375 start_codon:yes stop_codon:yes gene_type:complete